MDILHSEEFSIYFPIYCIFQMYILFLPVMRGVTINATWLDLTWIVWHDFDSTDFDLAWLWIDFVFDLDLTWLWLDLVFDLDLTWLDFDLTLHDLTWLTSKNLCIVDG